MDPYLHTLVNCRYFLVHVPEQGAAAVVVVAKAETDLHSEGEASELELQNPGEFVLCPNMIIDLNQLRYIDGYQKVNAMLITKLTVKGHPFNVRPPTP